MTLALLRVMGCDLLQGYFISRPLPFDALIAFLADNAHLNMLSGNAASTPWAVTRK